MENNTKIVFNRKNLTIIGVFVLVMSAILVSSLLIIGSRSAKVDKEEVTQVTDTTATNTEIKIEDLKVGTGKEAKSGNKVSVNYLGTLTDGTKFDSSYDRNQPFRFGLGAGEVIPGWDQGVVGMKEGGKRKLTIPPALGYGDRETGPVPANSTLVFEIELLKVE